MRVNVAIMEGVGIFVKYKKEIIVFGLLLGLYVLLRLPNLTSQPIFADEAIYIRWAQVMRSEPSLRFLPLTDGKTPLFMWSMMPMFKIFEDPLFAGRFLSFLTGWMTLLAIFFLGRKVFNPTVGFLGAFLYAITPYTVFFDRLALVDSMLAAFCLWSLYFALWLVTNPRLDLAMILGFLMGGSILTKTPSIINILVLPFTFIAFPIKKQKKQIMKLLVFWIVTVIIVAVCYNILRLGPGFQQLSSRDSDYVFSVSEVLSHPLNPFIPHLGDVAEWTGKLLSWPIFVFIILGMFFILKRMNRLGLVVIIWAGIPFLVLMSFLKTFTARYLLLVVPPLLLIGSYGIYESIDFLKKRFGGKVDKRILIGLVFVLVSAFPLVNDYLILNNVQSAFLPRRERRGYLEDWTAGYGFPEIANFLMERKKEKKIIVGTEGYFGTLPEGIQIYLDKSGIPVIGGGATISAQLRNAAIENETYFLANKSRMPMSIEGTELIKIYPKASPLGSAPQDAILLFRVFPE